jgi:hypothetical protein
MYFCVVLCTLYFVSFSVLFVCICVLNYCHRVATQLQLNISYHIIYLPEMFTSTQCTQYKEHDNIGTIEHRVSMKSLNSDGRVGRFLHHAGSAYST